MRKDAVGMPANATQVLSGVIFDVWQWEQELYDGSTTTFERISRNDYAYAIGVLPDQQILLLEDEQPDRPIVITPAGGRMEDREQPDEAVRREFKEETGYTIGELIAWHSYQPSNKMFLEVHAFIARDLQDLSATKLDPGERVKPVTYSFDEFLALGTNDMVRDWMLRIKLLEAQLDSEKREELRTLLYG